MPDWNRDIDFLRWKYDIQTTHKIRDVVKSVARDEAAVKKELQKFEMDQKGLLKKIETIDNSKFKVFGQSKSEEP